ncbi:TorF family putative porin [Agaribacterium sp. ZY112]|uniref:TorF family putative porin n=1 Tax=Agaribacterium sp. ZY112 TaxID=3233574 RepID=UPI0035264B30
MKFTKKAIAGVVAAATMAAAVAPAAQAEGEVSASVGVASTYLWRGKDLGSGTPAVSGDLSYSNGGFYTGIWGSSGDTDAGTEYDLYLGYGGEVGKFFYDVSAWTYSYPTGGGKEETGTPGNLAEAVATLGYGPVSATYYQNVVAPGDDDGEYSYVTLAAELGAFGITYGQHFEGNNDLSHLDLSYAYNDNLSFIISTQIEVDEPAETTDPTFVVSYSLPIE